MPSRVGVSCRQCRVESESSFRQCRVESESSCRQCRVESESAAGSAESSWSYVRRLAGAPCPPCSPPPPAVPPIYDNRHPIPYWPGPSVWARYRAAGRRHSILVGNRFVSRPATLSAAAGGGGGVPMCREIRPSPPLPPCPPPLPRTSVPLPVSARHGLTHGGRLITGTRADENDFNSMRVIMHGLIGAARRRDNCAAWRAQCDGTMRPGPCRNGRCFCRSAPHCARLGSGPR